VTIDTLGTEERKQKAVLVEEAVRHSENGAWEEAVSANSEVLAMDPEDIAALNRLGRSLTKLGRLRDALDAYTRATTVDAANAIALRNSTRLRAILETAGTETVEAANPSELRADHFIMETGRSAVLELENLAPVAGLATVLPGDVLEIQSDGPYLRLYTSSGAPLGTAPAERSHRILELMSAGNEYSAVVVSATHDSVLVLIRETFRSPESHGKLPFPPVGRTTAEARPTRAVGAAAVLEDEFTAEPDIDDDDEVEDGDVTTDALSAKEDADADEE